MASLEWIAEFEAQVAGIRTFAQTDHILSQPLADLIGDLEGAISAHHSHTAIQEQLLKAHFGYSMVQKMANYIFTHPVTFNLP